MRKSGGPTNAFLGISVAVAILAGGLYAYKSTHVPAQSQAGPYVLTQNPPVAPPAVTSAPSASSEQPNPVTQSELPAQQTAKSAASLVTPPVTPKKATKTLKPTSDAIKSAPAAAATIATPPPVAAVVAAPAPAPPARVDFDPKSLTPSENTRLRIEADRFPPNINFTLEMNGKILFERGSAKTQTSFDDVFIPPGVHELRVVAGTGSNRKSSNIVSTEFKAKKKKTLRLELRTQGKSSDAGVPQDVYSDSQIFVTLK